MSKSYRKSFEEDEDWATKEMASGGWIKPSGAGKSYLELKDKSHESHYHYTSENNGCPEKWLHFLVRGKGLPKGGVEVYPMVKSEDGIEIENAIAFYKHCKGRKALRGEDDCLKFKLRITSLSSKDQDKRRVVVFKAVKQSVKSVESAPKTVLSKKTRKRKRSCSPESEADDLPKPQAKHQFQSAEGAMKHYKSNIEEVINKWTAYIMSLEKKIESQSQMLTSQQQLLNEQAGQIRANQAIINQYMSEQICNKMKKPELPDITVDPPFSFNANLLQFDEKGNESLFPDSVLESRESSIGSLPDFAKTFDAGEKFDDLLVNTDDVLVGLPKFDFEGLGLLASN